MPERIGVEQAAELAGWLHHLNGGATVNLYFGDMSGQALFAVSLYPEQGRAAKVRGPRVPLRALEAFIRANEDLLADPRNSIGLWHNAETGVTFLDVSATLPDRRQARELARRYNQIAYYDLRGLKEIAAGGTGEPAHDLAPARERLPELPARRSGEPKLVENETHG